MRLAVLSDIHGNLTAFEPVLADLKSVVAPDLVVHGGDLAANGARPAEIVDAIRDLGWPGVCGNTDEMLWRPELLSARVHGALRPSGVRGEPPDTQNPLVVGATCGQHPALP